jgi:NAD(P)-dependent dehydrogenase (short-subunit alcohol dehydrogenase family)
MNKIAVVTGAGTGIGRHSAIALAEAGFITVLAGRREALLEETAAAAPSGKTLVAVTDITKREEVKRLFDTVVEKYGRVDVLFNNAGMSVPVPIDELSLEKWEEVVAVNLTGSFLCAQAAFRVMKDQRPQGGRIINNGSISAHAPRPNSVAYTSTKHAITGLTKCISLDGRKYDIACGQIDIGNAGTPMTQRMSTGTLQANGRTEPEPTMDVENVAHAVTFMAGLPLDANVQFMTVMATKMPFVGRG